MNWLTWGKGQLLGGQSYRRNLTGANTHGTNLLGREVLTNDEKRFRLSKISRKPSRSTPTPEDSTTEKRWEVETPYLGAMIVDHLALDQRSRVLDYGCGIGRSSKEI